MSELFRLGYSLTLQTAAWQSACPDPTLHCVGTFIINHPKELSHQHRSIGSYWNNNNGRGNGGDGNGNLNVQPRWQSEPYSLDQRNYGGSGGPNDLMNAVEQVVTDSVGQKAEHEVIQTLRSLFGAVQQHSSGSVGTVTGSHHQ